MDTGLIFLGTEQAVEHVPGRPEHVLDGDPFTNVWRNAVHPSGKMHAGVWDCRAGAFELPCHASTELCVITEGSAEIEDAQGRKTLVKPGDAFIIPQGSRTVWRIEEYVKKYYLCVLDLEELIPAAGRSAIQKENRHDHTGRPADQD